MGKVVRCPWCNELHQGIKNKVVATYTKTTFHEKCTNCKGKFVVYKKDGELIIRGE